MVYFFVNDNIAYDSIPQYVTFWSKYTNASPKPNRPFRKRKSRANKTRMGSDGDEGGHGEAEAVEHAPSVF